jgi:hypothetical protein
MANFLKNSRYTGGVVAKTRSVGNIAGKPFCVARDALGLPQDDGDCFATVTKELIGRPDLLASKFFGSPDLWWVIPEFNGILDPLKGFKVGDVLRIPSLDRVLEAIDAGGLIKKETNKQLGTVTNLIKNKIGNII